MLFFATRDPDFKLQIQGVAAAPLNTNFNRNEWKQLTDSPIMVPEYDWEGECVEGASVTQRGNELFMFYAGAYNNWPQQIGVAKSSDGIHWHVITSYSIHYTKLYESEFHNIRSATSWRLQN